MPAVWVSPTAFMTSRTTAAPSTSASLTIRRPSPPIPSPLGGNAKVRVAGAVFPSFWFWPTQAAATVALPGPGKPEFKLGCAMRSDSPLRSLTTLPALPNGIPSSIVCSPRSPKNWAAEPLDSYEKMLKFIRTTNTQTGLVVTAYLDRKEYPTGLKPDPRLISSLRLRHGKTLPQWNYTIAPNL